ncbi:MAG: hypothetical protein NZ455_15155 [Bacteroidia bacterium]|nr:hypothetical protein [Bacteroidia bacterium]MDW8347754.1 hypothetical protein [Bacteroidia bacterium]
MRRACDSTVRSTEAIAQPAARRPCPHERQRNAGKGTPKNKPYSIITKAPQ